MEDKKKRIIFIVSIIVVIIITIIGSYFIYKNFYMENEDIQNGDSLENNEKKKELTFKMKSERQLCSDHDTDEDCITYTIETETTTPKYLSSMGTYDDITFVLYKDNGLKIYDFKNKETRKLNIPEDDYSLVYDSYNQTEYFGIINKNKNKYYDLRDGKETLITIIDKFDDIGIIYDDNGLKIYNIKTKEITPINLENKYEDYQLAYKKDEIYGIFYRNDEENGYYNIKNGKILYKNKYKRIYGISEDYAIVYEDTFGPCSAYKYLLSTNEEKVILENKENELCSTFGAYKSNNGTFLIKYLSNFYPNVNIYTEDLKIIVENIQEGYYIYDNNYFYIIENNVIKKYDAKGNLVDTITSYSKPLGFIESYFSYIKNYLVFVEDGYLKVMNLNEPNSKIEITKWQDNYVYQEKYANIMDNKIYFPIAYKEKLNEEGYFSNYEDNNGIELYYDLITNELTSKAVTGPSFTYQRWD